MEHNILKKATELFLKYGFKSVTMDDIANDLGISKKTIYAHYENKLDLVDAVVNYLFEEIIKIINDIKAQKLNPILESYSIHESVSHLLKDENESIDFQLKKYFPEIYDKNNCTRSSLLQKSILDNLTKGISDGYYRKNIDIEFISRFFLTILTSIKNAENVEILEFDKLYASKQFLELYFRGIVTEKGLKVLEQIINKEN